MTEAFSAFWQMSYELMLCYCYETGMFSTVRHNVLGYRERKKNMLYFYSNIYNLIRKSNISALIPTLRFMWILLAAVRIYYIVLCLHACHWKAELCG